MIRYKEKHKYPRLKATYPALYRSKELEDQRYREITLTNISAGGALFTTDEKLSVNSNIDLEIDLPRTGRMPLPAKIVRVEKKKGTVSLYNVAIKFRRKDRRKHPRIKANYLAWYKLKDFESRSFKIVTLRDISSGGALFTTDEKLRINSNIRIEIDLPEFGRRALFAIVVRVQEIKRSVPSNFYNIGVKFIPHELYKKSQECINNSIERLLSPTV